jgi:hypothetical protein
MFSISNKLKYLFATNFVACLQTMSMPNCMFMAAAIHPSQLFLKFLFGCNISGPFINRIIAVPHLRISQYRMLILLMVGS